MNQLEDNNVKQEHHEQQTTQEQQPTPSNHNNSNNDAASSNNKQEYNKSPITLQQIKQVHATMKATFKNRSVAGLVIALYDYLKLWALPSRQQKMKELMMQNAQPNGMGVPNINGVNVNVGQQQYPYQQLPQSGPTMPNNIQNQQYPSMQPNNSMQPYIMGNPQQPNNMYMQPYTVKPRGRGRPPKSEQQPQIPHMQQLSRISQMGQPKTKQQKEKMLAEIYLYRGYGISNAKAEVTFPMDANIYYTYMRTILFKAFARLEDIVASECKVQVTPSEDYKTIKFRSELCKCEKWMQRGELKTFQEYIRSVYDLNPQAVLKGDTIRLYRVVLARWQEVKASISKVQDGGNATGRVGVM